MGNSFEAGYAPGKAEGQVKRRTGLKVHLKDHLVLNGDSGYNLPRSKVAWFSLMDEKGNIVEKQESQNKSRRVPRGDLRPWLRVIDGMQETPRSFGGHREAA